jgi:hypothetical protein
MDRLGRAVIGGGSPVVAGLPLFGAGGEILAPDEFLKIYLPLAIKMTIEMKPGFAYGWSHTKLEEE